MKCVEVGDEVILIWWGYEVVCFVLVVLVVILKGWCVLMEWVWVMVWGKVLFGVDVVCS